MKKIMVFTICILTALLIMSGTFAEWQKDVKVNGTVHVYKPDKPEPPKTKTITQSE